MKKRLKTSGGAFRQDANQPSEKQLERMKKAYAEKAARYQTYLVEKRDTFAAAALEGLLASGAGYKTHEDAAKEAIDYANAMVAALYRVVLPEKMEQKQESEAEPDTAESEE